MTEEDIRKEFSERYGEVLSDMQKWLEKHDRYFILLTHHWEQGNGFSNTLITPQIVQKGGRFDEAELVGACVDMIMDFYDGTGTPMKDSMILYGASRALMKLYKEGAPEK